MKTQSARISVRKAGTRYYPTIFQNCALLVYFVFCRWQNIEGWKAMEKFGRQWATLRFWKYLKPDLAKFVIVSDSSFEVI